MTEKKTVAERFAQLEREMRDWPMSKVLCAAIGHWSRAGLRVRRSLSPEREFIVFVSLGNWPFLAEHVEEMARAELDRRLPVQTLLS